jgi:hypothetical protein
MTIPWLDEDKKQIVKSEKPGGRAQIVYKCNCTSCQKAGMFHMRVPYAPEDFLLLSPADPFQDLGDYTWAKKEIHFFFCKTCGMRCFLFGGVGEVTEVDLGANGVPGYEAGKLTKVWHAKPDGWNTGSDVSYLSINALTTDPFQEGFDMREWAEKKWIGYVDTLQEEGKQEQSNFERPCIQGTY